MSNSTTTTKPATTAISLRQFRENAQKIIDEVAKGKTFTVFKRSRAVLEIGKPKIVDEWGDEGHWETVVDFTKDDITVEEFVKMLRKARNE